MKIIEKIGNFFKEVWEVGKMAGKIGSVIAIFISFLAGGSYAALKFLEKIWVPMINGEDWK